MEWQSQSRNIQLLIGSGMDGRILFQKFVAPETEQRFEQEKCLV